MIFNINNYVKIKLTDEGREIHKKFYTEYSIGAPDINEDENGWSTWQMWSLMQIFGPHLYNGCNPPFGTEIEILTKGL